MNTLRGRIRDLTRRQHNVIARWQLARHGLSKNEIDAGLRGWRRVYQGVCALDDLTETGWLMAAALAGGPDAVLSPGTALFLLGLCDVAPAEVHVSVRRGGGRSDRDGIVFHRRLAIEEWHAHGVPVTSPTQSLKDAKLPPHELFHAIDRAENLGYPLTLPLDAIVRLQRATDGRTRSPAESRFILLCDEHQIEPPRVNHHLNGIEADFHWPEHRLVVEVDGYEFHRSREQFEEDRRRGLVHTAAGYTVIRVSASQVQHTPDLLVGAVSAHMRGANGRHRRR